ncbi:MAG TPA: 4-hydroxythreonine-4-phosphate dehydrogenase PdxA [Polyangia bacterium]|nr:4-hydroxythreonine-4-phosphate dehydrogenase PdxA [Polyangia bacterium]
MAPSGKLKNLLVTMGDPAGISAEVVGKAFVALARAKQSLAQQIGRSLRKECANLAVVGDAGVLAGAMRRLRHRIPITPVADFSTAWLPPTGLRLFAHSHIDMRRFRFGSPVYGREQLGYLDFAIEQARRGRVAAIVTGPVTKEAVATLLPDFVGHTGYLAKKLGARDERMAFLTPDYLLALQTTHIPLCQVSGHLKPAGIVTSLKMLAQAGRARWGRKLPVAVLGLNPHAGEHGLMGDEEARVIVPAMQRARRQGIACDGPFPADSFFIERVKHYQLILAMYHDQGLIAVKPAFPRASVNVTLGLPVVRTSVDHGSGYDIAGRGIASEVSLLHAIKAALELLAGRSAG